MGVASDVKDTKLGRHLTFKEFVVLGVITDYIFMMLNYLERQTVITIRENNLYISKNK